MSAKLFNHPRVSTRARGAGMFRWPNVGISFFLLHAVGADGIIGRLYYGDFEGGFTTTTKLAATLNILWMAVSFALFWKGYRRTRRISTGGMLAISLALFLLVSVAWSIDPSTTFRRATLYLFLVFGTIGVASFLNAREFMGAMKSISLLCAVASIIYLAVSPDSALMHDEAGVTSSALRGIFSNKNYLGDVMTIGVLATMYGLLAETGRKERLWNMLMAMAFLVMAFASQSTTSISIIAYLYCATALISLYRMGGVAKVLGLSIATLLMAAVLTFALYPEPFLEMVGKDPTLTGRTVLWELVIRKILERPILGWGFFAFWGLTNPIAVEIDTQIGWGAVHAHNGLLEMLLEVGIVGTAFFLIIFARSISLARRCLRTSARELGTASLLCCGVVVMRGLTESVLVDSTDVLTFTFFILWLICERVRQQRPVVARRPSYARADQKRQLKSV